VTEGQYRPATRRETERILEKYVHDPRFTTDLRDIPAILGRTALATPRRVLVAAIAIVVLMGAATGVLARAYHEAQHRRAQEQFQLGEAAASAGRAAEALESYRAALMLERDNDTYRRALAISLIGLRRTAEAETHLGQLLADDPVDGEANLLLARIAASRGAFTETEAFYQRAIYGRWTTEPAARRLATRFELIEWLIQVGARVPARAELLRLQVELPDVPFLQRELARRLLALGQPVQAADILRRELARRPDASVAADLVKVELAAGRLPEARDAARRAVSLDPRDRVTRARLEEIAGVLALDPTAPRLSAVERFRRSQRLLRRVRRDLEPCLGKLGPNVPLDLAGAIALADALLADPQATSISGSVAARPTTAQNRSGSPIVATSAQTPERNLDARTDARLMAAEALWIARRARCGASPQTLAWIFDRLSR
jgi:tetratricopeptide (TPR) repeat protein